MVTRVLRPSVTGLRCKQDVGFESLGAHSSLSKRQQLDDGPLVGARFEIARSGPCLVGSADAGTRAVRPSASAPGRCRPAIGGDGTDPQDPLGQSGRGIQATGSRSKTKRQNSSWLISRPRSSAAAISGSAPAAAIRSTTTPTSFSRMSCPLTPSDSWSAPLCQRGVRQLNAENH